MAFSYGSLLYGFSQRIEKRQPIAAPSDIKRYFVTPQESGQLCLMSCIFGENRDVFFPKLNETVHLKSVRDIAIEYLKEKSFEAYVCDSEDEARTLIQILPERKMWPCFFTKSDTTGEKKFEEFYTDKEMLDMNRFEDLGVIKNEPEYDENLLNNFEKAISEFKFSMSWDKKSIVNEIFKIIPNFEYNDRGKYLNGKM